MPIKLISGLPGNGKTLLMVSELEEQAKLATRPLFESGIDGLNPGLATHLDDPRAWNAAELRPGGIVLEGERLCDLESCPAIGNANREENPHVHTVPDGSLIFVDEAWKWFGHLHDARGQKTPPEVLGLAEHRHRGIDFVWTTQSPSQIYPFARALIAEHTHIVRRFGTHMCDLFTWSELNDDVKSKTMREAASRRTWLYPKSVFNLYKSATQHTIKRKIPFKLWALPVVIVLTCTVAYYAYKRIQPSAVAATASGVAPAPGTGAALVQPVGGPPKEKYVTLNDYVKAHTPRFAGQPWSAPIYDGRSPTADPQLLCVTSGKKGEEICHCYTEQVTPYTDITGEQCMLFAHQGVYNPYKLPSTPGQGLQGSAGNVSQPASVGGSAGGANGAGVFAQGPHYGEIHTAQPAPDTAYPANSF